MDKGKSELPLRIILDIPSLKNEYSERLLRYNDNELFEFLAVGGSSRFPQIKIDFENQFLWFEREFLGQASREEYAFLFTEEMINSLAATKDLKPDELKLLFIAQALTFPYLRSPKTIMVTQRKKLLNYGQYTTIDLPEFTIFDPEEAALFIDLFCKSHRKYMLYPQCFANKGLWYTYSMRAKLQKFHVAWAVNAYSRNPQNMDDRDVMEMMGSISNRMKDMLKAIDEIGTNYYAGSNNDTLADTIYHFNYWLTLYSGILDALAWTSLYRYNIPPPNENKVSIKSKDVLDELDKRNPQLKEVLSKNRGIIDLVYDARNMVVHREMLQRIRFTDRQLNLSLSMIKVNGEFLAHIKALQPLVPNGLNKAGLYELPLPVGFLLEPYRFVRFATRRFVDFLNLYVTTLDYEEFLSLDQQLKQKIDEAAKMRPKDDIFTMTRFQEDALGY
jgi:hypothetical protein